MSLVRLFAHGVFVSGYILAKQAELTYVPRIVDMYKATEAREILLY